MQQLPGAVVEESLTFLPVEQAIEFRLVCSRWRSVMVRPEALQLQYSLHLPLRAFLSCLNVACLRAVCVRADWISRGLCSLRFPCLAFLALHSTGYRDEEVYPRHDPEMRHLDAWLHCLPIQSLQLLGEMRYVPSIEDLGLRCLSVCLPVQWTDLPCLADLELLEFEVRDGHTSLPPPGFVERRFPALRGLRVRGLDCPLGPLPLSQLRDLELTWMYGPPSVSIDIFCACPLLATLKLKSCRLTACRFAPSSLRQLELSWCKPERDQQLVDLLGCVALQSFNLKTKPSCVMDFWLPPSVRHMKLCQMDTRIVLSHLRLLSRLESLVIDDIGREPPSETWPFPCPCPCPSDHVTLGNVYEYVDAVLWLSRIFPCCTDQNTATLRLCYPTTTFTRLLDVVAGFGLHNCTRVPRSDQDNEFSRSCSVRSLTKWTRTSWTTA